MSQVYGKPSQQLTHSQVRKVVNRLDPMGLLKMGAPEDEYDTEVKAIVSRRNEGNQLLSPEEIRVIFEYWFSPGCIKPETALELSTQLQSLFNL